MKYSANKGAFLSLLWIKPDQNKVRPWRYSIPGDPMVFIQEMSC
ncbi:hypothetical protein [Desulfocicer vacuolatum]|nr:hypothetical protein [Desulfocicer vacuolatum]